MPTMKDKITPTMILDAVDTIRIKAEKQELENSLRTFVPVIDFANLSTLNTQIIYGRNGTGKTHIFKAYYQYCEDNYEMNKIIPIYIDCRDLELGPVLPKISLDELIIRFYRMFVLRTVDRLNTFADKVLTTSLMEKMFGGKIADRKAQIAIWMNKLDVILDLKQIEERLSEYVKTLEVERSVSGGLKSEIGVSSKFSLAKTELSADGSVKVTQEDVENEKEKIALVYKGLAVIKYADIREALENIVELCGANAIVVLADEWSSVSISIQPVLAEMIRTTLAVSNKIALKIATSSYLTQTSAAIDPPQRIGLQPGVDVTQLADLDDALTYDLNSQVVKDFLTIVIYKHTCQLLPELDNYSVREFEEYLCREIFESPEVYLEVTRSSEGNARDFIIVLSDCCRVARMSGVGKITHFQAIHAASTYFLTTKSLVLKSDTPAIKLYRDLFKFVVMKKQKLFLVSTEIATGDLRLEDLWHHRFLHLVNKSYFIIDEDGVPSEYMVYTMDYGKLLTLKVQATNDKLVALMLKGVKILESLMASNASVISENLIVYMSKTVVGGKLLDFAATSVVAAKGLEVANLGDINALAKDYVADEVFAGWNDQIVQNHRLKSESTETAPKASEARKSHGPAPKGKGKTTPNNKN